MTNTTPAYLALNIEGDPKDLTFLEEAAADWLFGEDWLGSSRETWREEGYCPEVDKGERAFHLRLYFGPEADLDVLALLIKEGMAKTSAIGHAEAIRISPCPIGLADWATQWQKFFKPIALSDRFHIVPAWHEEKKAPGGGHLIRIQPGRAFGSGTHPTTQVMLLLMEKMALNGCRGLDFGAGSGILTVAAGQLGMKNMVAVELDPDSRENFLENLTLNGMDGEKVDWRCGKSDVLQDADWFDWILCNVLWNRVKEDFPALYAHLKPGGRLIYSGYLLTESERIEKALKEMGLEILESAGREDWGGCVLKKA